MSSDEDYYCSYDQESLDGLDIEESDSQWFPRSSIKVLHIYLFINDVILFFLSFYSLLVHIMRFFNKKKVIFDGYGVFVN